MSPKEREDCPVGQAQHEKVNVQSNGVALEWVCGALWYSSLPAEDVPEACGGMWSPLVFTALPENELTWGTDWAAGGLEQQENRGVLVPNVRITAVADVLSQTWPLRVPGPLWVFRCTTLNEAGSARRSAIPMPALFLRSLVSDNLRTFGVYSQGFCKNYLNRMTNIGKKLSACKIALQNTHACAHTHQALFSFSFIEVIEVSCILYIQI